MGEKFVRKKVRLVLFVIVMAALYALPLSGIAFLLKVYDSFWMAYLQLFLPAVIAVAVGMANGIKDTH